jgi:hypothetical protein
LGASTGSLEDRLAYLCFIWTIIAEQFFHKPGQPSALWNAGSGSTFMT